MPIVFGYRRAAHADPRIRRRLKLRDLDTLMAVAQWGSMAKAATHLRVSQPAVSKAIADMEHTLGVRLLDRLAQGIEPTLYGRALLKSAAAVFDDVRQGINEIEFLGDSTAGEVRIGATEPMIAGLLPAVLDRLHRQSPRIAFHVTQITLVMAQVRELRERNVDLTLGRLVRPLDDDMNAEELFDEHVFVVAGTNCPWARRRKIELAELMNEPWAIPPRETFIGSLFADAFQAQGLGFPQTKVIAGSFQLYFALLATGRYLAILPGSMLRFSGKRLGVKILPVDFPIQPWPVAIVTLKKRTLSPVVHLFIDCVREVAKPLANQTAPRHQRGELEPKGEPGESAPRDAPAERFSPIGSGAQAPLFSCRNRARNDFGGGQLGPDRREPCRPATPAPRTMRSFASSFRATRACWRCCGLS